MRLVIALLFVPLIASASGEDSVFVRFRGDTTEVWNSNVMANCASRFSIYVEAMASGFLIIETDTSQKKMTCTCLFDLKVDLANITPGHYFASVKREFLKRYGYPKDTLVHIGRVEFDVTPPANSQFWARGMQSECKPEVSVPGRSESIPSQFTLSQNYPNPFNPSTTIRYELPKSSMVRVSVYDILGREVSVLVNERKNAGAYEVRFDAAGLASAVYLYRLYAGDFTRTKRLMVLK
jgi:hypothetical protein